MRKVFALVRLDVAQVFKDRSQLFGMIALPLLLTLFFGLMLGGSGESRVSVALADADGSEASVLAARLVREEPSFRVVEATPARARILVGRGDVAAAVILPSGFGNAVRLGQQAEIELVKDPRDTAAIAVGQVIEGVAGRIAADARIADIALRTLEDLAAPPGAPPHGPTPSFDDLYKNADAAWEPRPPVTVDSREVRASAVRGDRTVPMGFSQFSLGFTVMFVLFIAFNGAGGILEERENGTLARLLTTPTSKTVLLAGKLLGVYTTCLAQALIMISVGAFVFRVPWGNDPLGVAVIVGVYALAATGLGLLLSSIVRTRSQISSLGSVLAVVLAMLGGCYWPIDIVSPTMRSIAWFTPTGWAMRGLTDIVVRNQGLGQAWTPALVLLGFAAVSFAAGVRALRFE